MDPGLEEGKGRGREKVPGHLRSQRSEDGSSSGLSIKTCKDKKDENVGWSPLGEGDMETPSCEAKMGLDSTCSSKGRRARARRMSSLIQ